MTTVSIDYQGPERRIHTVFVTRNSEYHTRSGVCLAVRDLRTTAWMAGHEAVGMQILSTESGGEFLGRPLLFLAGQRVVKTSPVLDTARPPKQVFEMYSVLLNSRS